MQKDLKIGLAVGLGLVAGAVAWVATRPSMSPEARMPQPQQAAPAAQTSPVKEPNEQPTVSVIPRSPEPNLPQTLPAPAATPPVETPPQETAAAAQKPAEAVSDSTVHEQTEKIETQRFYIVRRGDTLSKISAKYYGSAGQWRKILEANKQTLTNPDKLTPGQKLIIP